MLEEFKINIKDIKLENNDFTAVAETILKGLGGKENVVSIDNCVTRLRLEIKDNTRLMKKLLSQLVLLV